MHQHRPGAPWHTLAALTALVALGTPMITPVPVLGQMKGAAHALEMSIPRKGVVPNPVSTTDPPEGVHGHPQSLVRGLITDEVIGQLRELGVGTVRLDMQTVAFGSCVEATCHTADGAHFFDVYDPMVARLRAADIAIVALLGPGLVKGNINEAPDDGNVPVVDHFSREAKLIATRYRDSIFLYEIWNEPNSVHTYVTPRVYAELAQQVTNAVKEANPAAQTISGGLFTHTAGKVPATTDDETSDGAGYIKEVFQYAGAAHWHGSPWSYLGWHLYICDAPTECPTARDLRVRMRSTFEAFWNAGHCFPVMITELGFKGGGHGEATDRQARAIAAAYDVVRQFRGRIAMAAVYKLQDAPSESFGLLGVNGQRKPAYGVFAAIMGLGMSVPSVAAGTLAPAAAPAQDRGPAQPPLPATAQPAAPPQPTATPAPTSTLLPTAPPPANNGLELRFLNASNATIVVIDGTNQRGEHIVKRAFPLGSDTTIPNWWWRGRATIWFGRCSMVVDVPASSPNPIYTVALPAVLDTAAMAPEMSGHGPARSLPACSWEPTSSFWRMTPNRC